MSTYGAGIMTSESDVVISNVIIRNNSQLRGEGAGIAIFGGHVLLQDSIISGNSAVKGAGIACNHHCNLTVIQSVIEFNVAVAHGGGIKLSQRSQIVLEGSVVQNNHAASGAGIVAMGHSDVISIETTFEDNESSTECDHVLIENGGIPSRFESTQFLSAQHPTSVCLNGSNALFSKVSFTDAVSIECNNSAFVIENSKVSDVTPKCNSCNGIIDGDQVCKLEKKGWFNWTL